MKTSRSVVKFLSTFLYIGYIPVVPGTFASLAGILLFYLVKGNTAVYLGFTLTVIILGFLISGRAEDIFKKKDHRQVVIDEIAGMLLSLIFLPCDARLVIIAFIIFSILDAIKPFPAGRLEKRPGGIGIMMDDIVSGIYTNIILQIALRFASFKIS